MTALAAAISTTTAAAAIDTQRPFRGDAALDRNGLAPRQRDDRRDSWLGSVNVHGWPATVG
jgi:hypothetical protein